ncbi:palladin isoform X1 [Rattus norvegicus]|uniref:palladin isoform X1 n=1 Tax=Rattus norvegicus TaxID=10116 RepID=UPI0003D0E991
MSETSSHDSFYDSLSDMQEEGRSADFFPGLSAFLSQEEINKSLDLARRAIDNSETEDFDSEKEISQIFSKSPTSLCETPSYEEKKSGEQTSSEGPRDNRRASVQPLAEQAERITSPAASKRKPGVSPLLASPSYIRSLRKAEKRGAKVPNPSAKPKAAQQSKTGPQSQLCDKAASFIEELTSIFREAAKPRNRSPNGESSSPDSGYLSPKNQPSTLMSASASQSPTADQLDQLEMDAEVKQPQGSLCYQAHKAPEETLPHTHIPHPQPQKARHLPSSAPRFIQKLRSQEVAEGSRVYLECRVTGNPAPRVRKNGVDKVSHVSQNSRFTCKLTHASLALVSYFTIIAQKKASG